MFLKQCFPLSQSAAPSHILWYSLLAHTIGLYATESTGDTAMPRIQLLTLGLYPKLLTLILQVLKLTFYFTKEKKNFNEKFSDNKQGFTMLPKIVIMIAFQMVCWLRSQGITIRQLSFNEITACTSSAIYSHHFWLYQQL